MTLRNVNRQWRLKTRPVGEIKPGDLELVESPKPVPGKGEILVRNIYLSLDPTNRIWMSDQEQYMPPVAIGDVMRGGTLGVVEQSNDPGFAVGDIVIPGMGGWQDYSIGSSSGPIPSQKLPRIPGLPLTSFMSALGFTGATAYFGLLDIGQPKAGETIVVSAAAGAVGQIVGQIGKIKGCRVVGIAGSDDKCRYVVKELGFDACINYKTENVAKALKQHCPNGIDVNFENVGGAIMDAVIANMNLNGRVALCGLISSYNAKNPVPGPYSFPLILMKRLTVKGFIILDFLPRMSEFAMQMGQWMMEGKIKDRVDVADGLENAVTTLGRLFTGGNTGKLLVKIGPEP
ncbi:MAG TPA: NADP-dependent oxidoreductase [Micropepsaceae bacterium]|nr:NADP-dependent oxidoreductase [Micropepsaceae bacterium]